jgi:hypothetical protein
MNRTRVLIAAITAGLAGCSAGDRDAPLSIGESTESRLQGHFAGPEGVELDLAASMDADHSLSLTVTSGDDLLVEAAGLAAVRVDGVEIVAALQGDPAAATRLSALAETASGRAIVELAGAIDDAGLDTDVADQAARALALARDGLTGLAFCPEISDCYEWYFDCISECYSLPRDERQECKDSCAQALQDCRRDACL